MPQHDREVGSNRHEQAQSLPQTAQPKTDGAAPERIDLSQLTADRTNPVAFDTQESRERVGGALPTLPVFGEERRQLGTVSSWQFADAGSEPPNPVLQRRHALEQLAASGTALAYRARDLLARRPTRAAERQAADSVATPGQTWWRPLGIGFSTGCLIALLGLGLGHSHVDKQPLPVTAIATPSPAVSAPQEDWESSSSMRGAEIALDEVVIHAAPASWQPDVTPAALVELETRNVSVSGRAVAAVIMLKRTGNTRGRAEVRCKTIPGTAAPAKDYEEMSTIVQFRNKQSVRTLFVPILQQPPVGQSRTFSVTLERAPRGPSLGTVTSTTVTILGDG